MSNSNAKDSPVTEFGLVDAMFKKRGKDTLESSVKEPAKQACQLALHALDSLDASNNQRPDQDAMMQQMIR